MAEAFSSIESTLQEQRVFPPPESFSGAAHVKSMQEYQQLYRQSIDDPQGFWGKMAENLHWFKKWQRVLEWNPPQAKWFVGGKLNAAYNCLDLQIEREHGDKAAIL
jgi:acetyl-CoA synthetase